MANHVTEEQMRQLVAIKTYLENEDWYKKNKEIIEKQDFQKQLETLLLLQQGSKISDEQASWLREMHKLLPQEIILHLKDSKPLNPEQIDTLRKFAKDNELEFKQSQENGKDTITLTDQKTGGTICITPGVTTITITPDMSSDDKKQLFEKSFDCLIKSAGKLPITMEGHFSSQFSKEFNDIIKSDKYKGKINFVDITPTQEDFKKSYKDIFKQHTEKPSDEIKHVPSQVQKK